jgi:hypothetical protein
MLQIGALLPVWHQLGSVVNAAQALPVFGTHENEAQLLGNLRLWCQLSG